jgi:hypothetical protein
MEVAVRILVLLLLLIQAVVEVAVDGLRQLLITAAQAALES